MIKDVTLRDTRIDWIPQIPISWEISRSKYVFRNKSLKNNPNEPLLSVTQRDGVVVRSESDMNVWNPTDDVSGYKLIEPGDFVISLRSFEGGLELSKVKGIVSPAYTVLETIRKIDDHYFWWLMKSHQFIIELNKHVTGIRQGKNIGWDDFSNIYLTLPPIQEQKLISRYLDKKTSQIDSLIKKIEKKIELLKEQRASLINQYVTKGIDPNVEMKDSGVEWIGEIPKHWEMRKITHVTTLIGSGTTPKSDNEAYYLDGSINWLVTGDLNDGYVIQTSSNVTEKALKDHSSLKLYPTGSLLMAMYGATIGKLGILKIEATVNQATCVMNFNENNSVEFWFNVLFGNRNYIVSLGYGGGQPNISQDLIKSLRFPCPPTKKEQLEIVEAIKSRIGKHDSVIQMEHKRLVLSKEYRQSLISSVVTGKVRVTEEMI